MLRLKGHFSRIDHQLRSMNRRNLANTLSSVLSTLSVPLPPRAQSPYFVDTVGNVSTSNFQPSTVSASNLELRPRYPLMGGWTYNFTMGYEVPLTDSVQFDADTGEYVWTFPFINALADTPVDAAEVHLLLPEGSR